MWLSPLTQGESFTRHARLTRVGDTAQVRHPDGARPGVASEPGDPPAWFTDAVRAAVDVAEVEVAGTPISYRSWGEPGSAGLLLVHGGGAHARWWDHIAPLLTSGRRVVAMDLSGHG